MCVIPAALWSVATYFVACERETARGGLETANQEVDIVLKVWQDPDRQPDHGEEGQTHIIGQAQSLATPPALADAFTVQPPLSRIFIDALMLPGPSRASCSCRRGSLVSQMRVSGLEGEAPAGGGSRATTRRTASITRHAALVPC